MLKPIITWNRIFYQYHSFIFFLLIFFGNFSFQFDLTIEKKNSLSASHKGIYIQAIELEDFSYLRDQTSVFDAQSFVGYSIAPDGFPADKTLLYNPQGLWCNSLGDLYYAETAACSIRMIKKATQTVKTIGGYTYCGNDSLVPSNNIPATSWSFPATASQITGDSAGNLYVSVTISHIVLKISGSTNKLNRYAGSGNSASSAVDIDPLTADLLSPSGVAATPLGTLYIVDLDPETNVGRITFVPPGHLTLKRLIILPTSTNYITSIYFEPDYVYFTSDDGGIYRVDTTITPFVIDTVVSPTNSLFRSTYSYSLTYMYLIDVSNTPIVKLSSNFGTPVDQIGGGSQYEGIARNIQLEDPYGLTGDGNGIIYISQDMFISTYNFNTGLVNVSVGIPSTARFERQDNIPGSLAIIGTPDGLTGDTLGNIYFHDGFFRKVSAVSPHTMTVVTDFNISAILDMKYDRNRHGLVFLTNDGQIRYISISTGTVHGLGHSTSPKRLWVDSNSDIFFTTTLNSYLVNKLISNSQSVIIAGSTTATTDGDGGPALSARFTDLDGIWGNSLGDLFVIDSGSIRKIYYNSIASSLYINKITITDFTDPMYFITGDQYGNLYFTNGAFGTVSAAIPTAEFTYDYFPIAGVGYAHPPQPTDGPANSITMSPGHIWVSSVGNIFVTDPHYNIIREFHVRVPTALPTSQPTSQPSRQPSRQPTSQPTTQPTAIPSSLITASAIIRNYVGREEIENYTPLNQTTFSEVTNIWGDTLGNLYVADHGACSIRKVHFHGNYVSTIVGIRKCDSTTPWSYSDLRANIIATKKALPPMWGITGDTNGNIYYSLPLSHAIMIYYPSTLITTMFIGAPSPGETGGPNIGAQTAGPMGLMMNSQSCLFFADSFSRAIRYSCASNNQVITLINSLSGPPPAVYQVGNGVYYTLPGTGTYYYNYQTQVTTTIFSYQDMYGVWVDASGNLYAASSDDQLVYYYDGVTAVSSIAGGGSITLPFSPVNDPLSVVLTSPTGLWGDSANKLYIADTNRVLMLDVPAGTIQTLIGDAGSTLSYIRSDRFVYTETIPAFWVDRNRILYFQDPNTADQAIKLVSPIAREIATVISSSGDPFVCIQGDSIHRLFLLRSDHLDVWLIDTITEEKYVMYSNDDPPISDYAYVPISSIFYDDYYPHKDRLFMVIGNKRISSYNITTGNIVTLAGTTISSPSSSPINDEIALDSTFDQIKEIWVDSQGNIYVIDVNHVRKVYLDPSNRTRYRVRLIAGLGSTEVTPRLLNVRATLAELHVPVSITGDTAGNIYISDSFTRYIYYLSPSTGDGSYRINVFAGTGEPLLALDHTQSLAHETAINPGKLVMHQGSNRLYVHDTGLNIIREILPSVRRSSSPVFKPSSQPTRQPSNKPSSQPSSQPTNEPSMQPTSLPFCMPSSQPSSHPSYFLSNDLITTNFIGKTGLEENIHRSLAAANHPTYLWIDPSTNDLYYVESFICSIRKTARITELVTTIIGMKSCEMTVTSDELRDSLYAIDNIPGNGFKFPLIKGLTGIASLKLLYFSLDTGIVMEYNLLQDRMRVLFDAQDSSSCINTCSFTGPTALWLDSSTQQIYFGDADDNHLYIYDLNFGSIRQFTFAFDSSDGSPTDLIYDTTSNKVYLIQVWGSRVAVCSSTGPINYGAYVSDPRTLWLYPGTNHASSTDDHLFTVQSNGEVVDYLFGINGQRVIGGNGVFLPGSQERSLVNTFLSAPFALRGDSLGNAFISMNKQIARWNISTSKVQTYLGLPSFGDNLPANQAILDSTKAFCSGPDGNIYLLTENYMQVRQYSKVTGLITTLVLPSMISNTATQLFACQVDVANNFYVSTDVSLYNISFTQGIATEIITIISFPIASFFRIDQTNRAFPSNQRFLYFISSEGYFLYCWDYSNMLLIAGNGLLPSWQSYTSNMYIPIKALETGFTLIKGFYQNTIGDFYIIDLGYIRKLHFTSITNISTGFIRTIAGGGSGVITPNIDYLATTVQFINLISITGDRFGNVFVADYSQNRIFKLTHSRSSTFTTETFTIRLFAGNGQIPTLLDPLSGPVLDVPMVPFSLYSSDYDDALYALDSTINIIRRIHIPRPSASPTLIPTLIPTEIPFVTLLTEQPSIQPIPRPTSQPSSQPTGQPSVSPTRLPSSQPTGQPSVSPTRLPSSQPTGQPSVSPTRLPSSQPTGRPSKVTGRPSFPPFPVPTFQPTKQPSRQPTAYPSYQTSCQPTGFPTKSMRPSIGTASPSIDLSPDPSFFPTRSLTPSIHPTICIPLTPTIVPTVVAITAPPTIGGTSTEHPTESPTETPYLVPTTSPTDVPSFYPTFQPTRNPSISPTTEGISAQPTSSLVSTFEPTELPLDEPSYIPTLIPSVSPTCFPTMIPSIRTTSAISELPTESFAPTETPTDSPSEIPSPIPSMIPSEMPLESPSFSPSISFVPSLSLSPSFVPSTEPMPVPAISNQPTEVPNEIPTIRPSLSSTILSSVIPSYTPSEIPSISSILTPIPSITLTSQTDPPFSLYPTPSNTPVTTSATTDFPTFGQTAPSVDPPIQLTVPSINPTVSTSSQTPTIVPSIPPSVVSPIITTLRPSPFSSLFPSRVPTTTSRPSTLFPTRVNVTYVRIVHQNAEDATDHSLTAFQQVNFIFGTMQFNSLALRDITLPPIRSNNHAKISNYLVFGRHDFKPLQLMNTSSDSYQPIPNTQSLVSQDSGSSRSIALIADVNGDSFSDIVIGDPVSSRVYLLYGNQVGGMSPVYSLEDGKGSEIVSTGFSSSGSGGGNNFDYLGWAVTGGNDRISFDFNGDGLQDWAVSALSTGLVYIVYGRRSSLPRRFILSSLSASEGLVVVGSEETSNLGIAMSAVGDWNGDGYDDLLMTGMALNSNQQGNVLYLLLGGASLATRKRVLIDALWMSMDRKYLVKIVSPPLSFAGLSVSWVGDVNGDGFDDLLIGSIPYRGKYLVQMSYLVLGRNVTGSVASVNRTISLESSEGAVEVVGGGMMVRGVGDVDGDGYADMLLVSNGNWQGQSGSYLLRSPVRNELSRSPSQRPTAFPTIAPSSLIPSIEPSVSPTEVPSELPSIAPSGPTEAPSFRPTTPTVAPSFLPTRAPSVRSSAVPSVAPSSTRSPSRRPTLAMAVSFAPTMRRSSAPSTSLSPTRRPSLLPTKAPTYLPGSPTTVPIISSMPSIIPPDDPTSVNQPAANLTIIRVGGTTQDPPSIMNPSSSPDIVEKRVYVVDSPTDVTIQRSLPPSSTSSSVVGSGGSYRVYVIKPHKQMKTTVQPFLSSNDVLDLSAYTSYGIYSFEDLSFSQSGSGRKGIDGDGGAFTVILPLGQEIILHSIFSFPPTTSLASSSHAQAASASSSSRASPPNSFPLSASNFVFGIVASSSSSQDSNGNYGNIAESGSYQYFSSKDFWDGGLVWTSCWVIGLMLLTCCCVKMELDARDKKEKEVEDILSDRKSHEENEDDLEAAPNQIISVTILPRLVLSAISDHPKVIDKSVSEDHNGADEDDEDKYEGDTGDEDVEASFSFLSETFPSFHDENSEISSSSTVGPDGSQENSQSISLSSSSSSSRAHVGAHNGNHQKFDHSDSGSDSDSN